MFTRRHVLAGIAAASTLALGAHSATAASAETGPKEFRIGYQKSAAILVIAKQRQVLEKRLKKEFGVQSVKWVEFQFGPPILEALGAGAVDFGFVGDTPPIFAQAAGAKIVYVASAPASESAVLAPKDSPLKKVEELKGKKVAIAKGSSAHNLTVRALRAHGLKFADITPVYLAPADALAAFATGQVDAWSIWDPYRAVAETKYGARAIASTEDPRLASNSFYLANANVAEKYPRTIKAVAEELGTITKWADGHRDELAKIASEVTGVDINAQKIASKRARIDLRPVSDKIVESQQSIADAFAELKLIPHKITVKDIVWTPATN